MKISLNWIKDYIDLSGISTNEIINALTMHGLEVEDFLDEAKRYTGIVVGLVKEVAKHPDADKLTVCIVYDGQSE
ncbi:MAG: hypothetical protein ACHQLA_04150, partial [Ignavibacteriales bacterium]